MPGDRDSLNAIAVTPKVVCPPQISLMMIPLVVTLIPFRVSPGTSQELLTTAYNTIGDET